MCSVLLLPTILLWVAGTALSAHPLALNDYKYDSTVGKLYKLHETAATWREAREICRREKASLAIPHSEKEEEAIEAYHASVNNSGEAVDVWLGVYGTYNWSSIDDQPIAGYVTAEAPVLGLYLTTNGSQAFNELYETHAFVCEISAVAIICDTTLPGYTFNPDTHSCHKLHGELTTWLEALETCDAEGGRLAIINSKREAEHLSSLVKAKPELTEHPAISLGFHDMFKEGKYYTVEGRSLSSTGYTEWDWNQPDNYLGAEDCGTMHHNGKLNDGDCRKKMPFICEKEAALVPMDGVPFGDLNFETPDVIQ